jgi:hypothetical protein
MLPLLSISCGYAPRHQLKVWFSPCKSRSAPHFLTIFLIASSPLYYITALTALFESIALIVDQHQPIVDKYYGTGKMYSVVTRLIQECDKVVKSTLESFEEERAMQRKVGCLETNRGHRLTLTFKLSDTGAPTLQALSASSSAGLRPQTVVDEDIVDVKQIDKVSSELAAMSGRWNLFRKFLFDSLSVIYHLLPSDISHPGKPLAGRGIWFRGW